MRVLLIIHADWHQENAQLFQIIAVPRNSRSSAMQ